MSMGGITGAFSITTQENRVSEVNSNNPNGIYGSGQVVDVKVKFVSPVKVT